MLEAKSRGPSERQPSFIPELRNQLVSPASSNGSNAVTIVLGCLSLMVVGLVVVWNVNWLINDAPVLSFSHPSIANLGFSWSIKIASWTTIRELGMGVGCPMQFLKHENIYHSVSCGLFILSAYIGSYSGFPLIISMMILGAAWIVAGKFGHADACKDYREMMKILLDVVHNDKKRKDVIGQLNMMTDKELRARQLRSAGSMSEQRLARYKPLASRY